MRRVVSFGLSAFKYIIALFMMYAGIVTLFIQPEMSTKLNSVYGNKVALIILGITIFLSGATLFFAKLLKYHRTTGYGLFAVYNCFLFAGLLNWYALGWQSAWANLLAAGITGALYLRWKYNIYYYDPLDKTHKLRYISTTTE